jgi:hypothetical protein
VLPLEESEDDGGGAVIVSDGGVVAELDESAGAAGAVLVESDGALGEVDCCFEQATRASALRHNKTRLRFMCHLCVCPGHPAPSQRRWNTTDGRNPRSIGMISAAQTRQASGYG